jgi:O-antigen ligase
MYTVVASMAIVALCVPAFALSAGGSPALGGKVAHTPFGGVHLNVIAGGVTIVASVALGMAAGTPRVLTRVLLGVGVFLCVVALVVTKSRAAWFGLGAAFLYLLFRTRSVWLLLLAAGVVLGIVASDLLRSVLVSRAQATTLRDPSLLGRFVLWNYAWLVGKANWLFGVGLENFRYVKHLYGFPSPLTAGLTFNAHNIYLELFADLGLVGLLSFLWVFAAAIIRSSRAANGATLRDVGLGISAGLVACATDGLLESVIVLNSGVFVLTGLLVGLALATARLTRTDAQRAASRVTDSGFADPRAVVP